MGIHESYQPTANFPTASLDQGWSSSAMHPYWVAVGRGVARKTDGKFVSESSDFNAQMFVYAEEKPGPITVKPTESRLAEKLAEKTRINQIPVFEYQGVVLEVEDKGPHRSVATIHVRVDGTDRYIEKSFDEIGFKVGKNHHVIVQGVIKGGKKMLIFKKSTPLDLTPEQWAEVVPFWHVYGE